MKKIMSIIITVVVILSTLCTVASAGDYYFMLAQINNNKLFVNSSNVEFDEENADVMPIADENGNILIPIRAVVSAVGGAIDWVEETNSVVINYNDKSISFFIGASEATVDGETIELSVAPYTIFDRTVVSLDFFSKCMNGSADFDKDTNTAMLGFETTTYAKAE
ncbi:MAG: copper amine oxidase N-terminal domain-containing protein [Monoglobales bacterium]